jgi:S1-C subfamily serine protease
VLIVVVAIGVLVGVFAYLKDRPLEAGTEKTAAESPASIAAHKTEQPPPPVKLSPGEIASKYADAVVVLDNYDDQGQRASQGSGFISSANGLVLTNYHVIRGASRMVARTHDESTREVEYVAGFDAQHDIAVVKISGENLRTVQLGNSSVIKTGDHVTVLGAPLGLESTLSDGIISAIRAAGSLQVFQTSAPISHGSSGGPLFDDYGNVIGLAVSTIEAGENLNFAVPIDSAKPLLRAGRQTSFAELLSETAVHQPVLASSVSLPPQVTTFDIAVPPQGGILAGSFSIAGGMGNDLGMLLTAENGGLVWNGGVLRNSGNLNLRLRGGRYKLILNNKMGPFWVSPKTLSGTIELSYYR